MPQIQQAERYAGLYIVDVDGRCDVGLTAEQVAEMLDSRTNRDAVVYQIYKAYPDGRMELKGVRRELFELEAGMFFYARDEQAAKADFQRLCDWAQTQTPPARAKVHLASDNHGGFVTALIYPAEYDDAFSRWLLDGQYRTAGAVEAGTNAVQRYYDAGWLILDRKQVWGQNTPDSAHEQAAAHPAQNKQVS